ncbi:class I SAM-dependent methyltransferase [candidate division KSB1 bacterium]|nr:class I SAM-dependent methyltransferase [candidate division KSB1 bacterium]
MQDLEKSVVKSLDGDDQELYPYLPYLLQDLYEIGSSPKAIIDLIKKHGLKPAKVLDLGCGKGIISIKIAQTYSCSVLGIDGMPDFIQDAQKYARHHNVALLCRFEQGDIRDRISALSDFDLVILGSIGPVLGDVRETVSKVKQCLKPGGYILLDDGYLPENSKLVHEGYLTRSQVISRLQLSGCDIMDEFILEPAFMKESNDKIYQNIQQRANELIQKEPEKSHIFQSYLDAQRRENDVLENEMICVTWVLKKAVL